MDKYLRTIDMTEHPERYSDRELREMLADPETRDLYDTLCEADSALKPAAELSDEDVEQEWQRFESEKMKSTPHAAGHIMHIFGHRVAAVTIIAVTSLAALAVGLGVMMDRHIVGHKADSADEAQEVANVISYAGDTITERTDTLPGADHIVFESETLGTMLKEMTEYYGLKLEADNKTLLNIRLFYRWDRSNPMEEVVRQLNNFEKINLTLSDGTLTLK